VWTTTSSDLIKIGEDEGRREEVERLYGLMRGTVDESW
jgi:hypothetical protein